MPSIVVDAPYVQRAVGQTPFSSAKEPSPDAAVYFAVQTDANQQKSCQGYRVPFGVPQQLQNDRVFPENNAFFAMPPVSNSAHPMNPAREALPADTLHPLVSAMQASENAKAASFNRTASYLSNANRTGQPAECHQQAHRVGREAHTQRVSEYDDASDVEEEEEVESTLAVRAGKNSRRGDVKTAIGRAYNADSGFHDPEYYSTKVVEFASTQPATATAIAAKALASAIHDKPSFGVPSNVVAARAELPQPNSGVAGLNVNRHLFTGTNDNSNPVVPPSPAFRQLSRDTQGRLLNRHGDTRLDIEAARDVAHVDGVADTVEELLCRGGAIDVWQDALLRCGVRRSVPQGSPTASHPIVTPLAGRQLTAVAPHTASLFTTQSTRPACKALLGSSGLRMGDSITQVKLPSQSSFVEYPELAKGVKQFGNIPFTPSNAYAFDSERFGMMLANSGMEVEEMLLEGAGHIDTLDDIAKYCPNLKVLHAGGCKQLTTSTLRQIAQHCSLLSFVNVSNTDIDNEALACLVGLSSNLMTLSMSGLGRIDVGAERAFAALHRHRGLRVLDLSFCERVTDFALVSIAQYCPVLEVLDISGCFGISDVGVMSIGASCTALKVWKLQLCHNVTAAGLAGMALGARNLTLIDVSGCVSLTAAALEQVLRRTKCLRYLSISGCTLLDDTAVYAVARHCVSLKVLDLSSCVGVSLPSCMELVNDLPELQRLIVSESTVSNAEVVMLSSLRETCKIVRNQYRPPTTSTVVGYKSADVKKPQKKDAKKGSKK